MKKFSIKNKITLFMLSISVLSLLIFLITIQYNIQKEMSNSMKLIESLKNEASDESQKSLEEQAKKYLIRLVSAQAENSNSIFKTIEAQIRISTDYAEELWNNPERYSKINVKKREKKEKKNQEDKQDEEDIIPNPDLDFYYSYAPNTDTNKAKKELELLGNMDYIFKSIVLNNKELNILPVCIDGVYIGTEMGLFFNMTWNVYYNDKYDARERPWYEHAKNKKDLGWSDIYIDEALNDYTITCYSPVYDKKGVLKGVIGIDVMLNAMIDIINSQMKGIGYIFLVDNEGKILTYSKADEELREFLGKTDNLSESDNLELRNILTSIQNNEKNLKEIKYHEEKKLVAYAPVKSTNWSIVAVATTEDIMEFSERTKQKIDKAGDIMETAAAKSFKKTAVMILISFFGIVIIVVFVACKFAQLITNPILLLTDGVKKIGDGNLDTKIEVNTGDELQVLSEAYNKMTVELKKYILDLQTTTAAKQKIESELNVAHSIQEGILPRVFPPFPERREFEIYAMMEAAKEVGGDLYDFFMINESKLCFLIGDVSGKGVPASLFMMVAKTLLKNEALRGDCSVSDIFTRVNNMLTQDNNECLFVTAFICMLDLETGILEYSNAGHNPPLILKKDNKNFEYLKTKKSFVLGGISGIKYSMESMQLEKGDIIYLYTDGVTEAMDIDDNQYSEKRLQETISNIEKKSVDNIVKTIREDVKKFVKEAPQSDDITMIILKYNGK